jgi:catechol 2,3-dioxygenase-like lactoylglutathione lyase family enzyme
MRTTLGHVLCNVRQEHMQFYRDLMQFLGWETIMAFDEGFGVSDASGASLWFMNQAKDVPTDYDGPGVNHLAFAAASQADVDMAVSYLRERGVPPLFETPRHRPDFAPTPDLTYYQVMFESPDRLLLEVVYTGPRTA